MAQAQAPLTLPPFIDQNGKPIKVSGMQLHLYTKLNPEDLASQTKVQVQDPGPFQAQPSQQFLQPINLNARGPSRIPINSSTTANSQTYPSKDTVCAYLYPSDQSGYNTCITRLQNLYPQTDTSHPVAATTLTPAISTEDYFKRQQACLQQLGFSDENIRVCDYAVILGGETGQSQSQENGKNTIWW